MKSAIVELKCITNLHVGNGDVNYNIIDNEVERDPVTQYPTINSSGVKGSLRQFFRENGADQSLIRDIFGSDTSEGKVFPGQVKILAADMLAMPGRASAGTEAYYLMTTPAMLKRYQDIYEMFLNEKIDEKIDENDIQIKSGKVEIEGEKPRCKVEIGGHTLYRMPDETFRHISLPVMARNKLDDGKSSNLWYEEVVPHESIFYFPVIADNEKLLERFIEQLDGHVVQFGGNATIGYGLCKVDVHTKA